MIRTRTFHAVGQGAFCSEKHDGFSIVYDCGTLSKHDYLSQEILSLNKDEQVILFISHFDNDHISGITELKDHVNITHVIMPLLYDEDKALLCAYFKRTKQASLIISDPEKFFNMNNNDLKTKIIYIEPNSFKSNEEPFYLDTILDEKNDESSHKKTIESGRVIKKNKDIDWGFVPYNYDSKSRCKQIQKLLKNLHINIKKFVKDPQYALSQIDHNKKQLKLIFNNARGNGTHGHTSFINENSMFLYSGPIKKTNVITLSLVKGSILWHLNFKSGCIYTGDGNLKLKNFDLNNIYSNYIQHVGTVQIPHHGSINNFKEEFFINENYICPISTGHNHKNFPSPIVIKALIKACCFPCIVTEKIKSFIEEF